MASSIIKCARLVLLLSTLTVSLSWGTYDLDEKFATLEKKLDFLIAQVGNGSVAPPSKSGSFGISSLDSWITPLEVWRQPVGDNIKFTIKFKARDNGLVKWWTPGIEGRFTMPTQYISGSSEVQEVTYIVHAPIRFNSYDNVLAMFHYSEPSTSNADLTMELTNGMETKEMKSAITLPPFGIEPLGDLVYDEGKNITIKLRIPYAGGDERLLYDSIHCQVYLVDEENEVVNQYFEPQPDMYKLLEINNKTDETLLTVKINTAKYDTSAFIGLNVGNVDRSEGALVKRVSLSKQIVIRPSSQVGPLPDGFLGFLMEPYRAPGSGVTQSACSVEEYNCSIGCQAVGEDIVDFTISRVESDGSKTQMNVERSDMFHLQEYLSTKSITFPPRPSGTERFECRIENSRGKVRVRPFEVTYFVQLDIVEDQSEVLVLNENETSNIRQLAFICTVKGSPAPNITFTIERYTSYDSDLAPDELEIEGNVITARKFETYDTSDPNGWQGEYKGKVFWAACYAQYTDEGNGPWGYDQYQFTLPDDVAK